MGASVAGEHSRSLAQLPCLGILLSLLAHLLLKGVGRGIYGGEVLLVVLEQLQVEGLACRLKFVGSLLNVPLVLDLEELCC